jgi:UDP-glucuronate 4-epimerase
VKLLITGTAGFIGFHLVQNLITQPNIEIVGLDCINDYYNVNLKFSRLAKHGIDQSLIKEDTLVQSNKWANYRFIKADLHNFDIVNELFKKEGFTHVCNLAAQAGVRYSIENPQVYIKSNIQGFHNILEACRNNNIEHLTYASSSSVYGLNETMPFSVAHNVDHPISLYAATKKSNELMAHTYSHLFGLPTTGLRFFTVYGPWGRPDMALFLFTKAILEEKPINVFNHGKMRRDFTYVTDIAEGISRVINTIAKGNPEWNGSDPDPGTSKAPYRLYNIGNNNPVELMDFISTIEVKLGKKAIKNYMPLQPGDVPDTYADVNNLLIDMDYQPQTSIETGVSAFIDWYLDYYKPS